MRFCTIGLFSIVALCSSGVAQAVTYPANILLGGEVQQSVISNQCYIARGSSSFQRNGAANRASVTISEMVANGHQLNGRMILVFTSTTGGTAHFNFATAYPTNIQVAPFSGYSQTYAPATKGLHTQFTIDFPGCALPVSAVYTSP
jgi:hypothetical protein